MASEGILRLVPGLFSATGQAPASGVYATGALKTRQFVAVKQSTVAFGVVESASYDDAVLGILQNKPDDGIAAEVAEAGVTKVLLGVGGCSIGTKLGVSNGTSGALIAATSAHYFVAIALEAGLEGELVSALIKFGVVP